MKSDGGDRNRLPSPSRALPEDANARAKQLLRNVAELDERCILSQGASGSNQVVHIVDTRKHPQEARTLCKLICKLRIIGDAMGEPRAAFDPDSLANLVLLYSPLHYSMHHLRGWVLVPALKTLHQLIAELQRANNVWATAFENDRQADRILNFASAGFKTTQWEPLILSWEPPARHDLNRVAMQHSGWPQLYTVTADGAYRPTDDPYRGDIHPPFLQRTQRPQHERTSPLLVVILACIRIKEAMEAAGKQDPASFFEFPRSVELAQLISELYELIFWQPAEDEEREEEKALVERVLRTEVTTRSQSTRAMPSRSAGGRDSARPHAGAGQGGYESVPGGGYLNSAAANFIADVLRRSPSSDNSYLPVYLSASDDDEPIPPIMLDTGAEEAQGLDPVVLDEQWSAEEQERIAEFERAAALASAGD